MRSSTALCSAGTLSLSRRSSRSGVVVTMLLLVRSTAEKPTLVLTHLWTHTIHLITAVYFWTRSGAASRSSSESGSFLANARIDRSEPRAALRSPLSCPFSPLSSPLIDPRPPKRCSPSPSSRDWAAMLEFELSSTAVLGPRRSLLSASRRAQRCAAMQ